MPRFRYEALSEDGRAAAGEVSAENEAAALDTLARQGFVPLAIGPAREAEAWWQREVSLSGTRKGAETQVLIRTFRALSTLLTARIALPRALDYAAANVTDRRMQRALERARQAVEDGDRLSDALRDVRRGYFPERVLTALEVGETANQLPQAVANIATLLEQEHAMRRDVVSALVYPIILLVMSALVMAVIIFYLAPALMPVFVSTGRPAPGFLQALASLGAFLSTNWLLSVFVIGICIVAGVFLARPLGRSLSRLALRVPGARGYFVKRETLSIAQALSAMLRSGASLPEALRAARGAVSTAAAAEWLGDAERMLIAGRSLSDAMEGAKMIDPMTVAMIRAGDESDRLAEVLDIAAQSLRAETNTALRSLISVITPLLTLTIGLGVGAIILTTIGAIMDLNDVLF